MVGMVKDMLPPQSMWNLKGEVFMKILKRTLIWSITALLLQSGIFFVIDKYYKNTLLNTKVKEEVVDKTTKPTPEISINIPSTAKEVQASFDGKYLSYYDNSNLMVVNSSTGKSNIVNVEKNSQQIYCKWFPDTNSIVLCERDLISKTTINIFTYNADNDLKQAPTDTTNHDIKFTVANSNATIGDIEMSSVMQIFYIKTMENSLKSNIFNNNVNGRTVPILTNKNIGNINAFQRKPNVVYEDTNTNLIKITNTTWSSGKIKACLLNTDKEDNIYVGTVENGKVKNIIYGSTDKTIDKWTSLVLESPVDKKNVIVTKEGGIYLNNILEGSITDQVSKKKIYYTGDLLKITDKKVISVDNGTIKRIDLT